MLGSSVMVERVTWTERSANLAVFNSNGSAHVSCLTYCQKFSSIGRRLLPSPLFHHENFNSCRYVLLFRVVTCAASQDTSVGSLLAGEYQNSVPGKDGIFIFDATCRSAWSLSSLLSAGKTDGALRTTYPHVSRFIRGTLPGLLL